MCILDFHQAVSSCSTTRWPGLPEARSDQRKLERVTRICKTLGSIPGGAALCFFVWSGCQFFYLCQSWKRRLGMIPTRASLRYGIILEFLQPENMQFMKRPHKMFSLSVLNCSSFSPFWLFYLSFVGAAGEVTVRLTKIRRTLSTKPSALFLCPLSRSACSCLGLTVLGKPPFSVTWRSRWVSQPMNPQWVSRWSTLQLDNARSAFGKVG